ncbi:MAG: DUF418 domain-containing protein [Phycisphaerales bacterium]|nr:MAG: DUF418 domain-containing protein [Phycisphaerales bacterium]
MESNQETTLPESIPVPELAATAPLAESDRIMSIDVLRGVAVLGILVMNIQSFSTIGAAYFNPTAYGDLEGINRWVWQLSHIFADQKFMTIFSMLFGAGVVVFTSRVEARGKSAAGLHYRRMGWLILFGLLHAHLLWFGDILYTYGMCGLAAYLFRRMRPMWLILIAVPMLILPSLLNLGMGWLMQIPEVKTQMAQNAAFWAPGADLVQEELDAYRGSWLDQAPYRSLMAVMLQTVMLAFWIGWRVGGLMLIGMALFKMGVFSAARSRAAYVMLIAVAVLEGVTLICCGIYLNFAEGWSFEYSMYLGGQFNYWASILVALGWVGLVMLVCKSDLLKPLTRPLAAVGRMAFTNYILHTVICTTIFYGHGFGLFGYVERWQQFVVVLGVWGFQLVVSPIWLKYYRFGPLEWLWRSLSYWRIQPMMRRTAV